MLQGASNCSKIKMLEQLAKKDFTPYSSRVRSLQQHHLGFVSNSIGVYNGEESFHINLVEKKVYIITRALLLCFE